MVARFGVLAMVIEVVPAARAQESFVVTLAIAVLLTPRDPSPALPFNVKEEPASYAVPTNSTLTTSYPEANVIAQLPTLVVVPNESPPALPVYAFVNVDAVRTFAAVAPEGTSMAPWAMASVAVV